MYSFSLVTKKVKIIKTGGQSAGNQREMNFSLVGSSETIRLEIFLALKIKHDEIRITMDFGFC